MLKNHWYPIIESDKVTSKKPLGIKRLNQKLVVWRSKAGNVICLPDVCPHRAAALSRGRVIEDCIECPYHGMQFDKDGHACEIPANGYGEAVPEVFNMTPFTIREAHGLVWFWYGDAQAQYPKLPWFENALLEKPAEIIRSDVMPVNYLRMLENMLDAHHIAFVHRSVGFGALSYVKEVEASHEGDVISAEFQLGSDPKAKRQFKKTFGFASHVVFPCLAFLRFSEKVAGMASITPIDDDHSWVYICYQQNFITLPIIGKFATWLAFKFDWDLLQRHQDLPIWQSQQLTEQDDTSHYHFFKADKGIALFFREYQRRKRQ